jgi:hypothetical protein
MSRPTGRPNVTTVRIRDAIQKVFDELGGCAGMMRWAKKNDANERIFYGQIVPKMLPLKLANEDGSALTVRLVKDDASAL